MQHRSLKTFHNSKFLGQILFLLFLSLLLTGCEKKPLWEYLFPKSYEVTPQLAEDQNAAYRAAIEDAKVAEPDEIITTLTAITKHNPDLLWDDGRVLMATWTDWDGYGSAHNATISLKREVWVTSPQELKVFCLDLGLTDESLDMRLRQLLGLPPDAQNHSVAELWVNPKDMFRPSPDPEITDHESQLDFPGPRRYINITSSHRRWITGREKRSYNENGYPWTRLGYTYDWGNPKSEVGLSEFVIRKGARVIVHSTKSTNEYCSEQ